MKLKHSCLLVSLGNPIRLTWFLALTIFVMPAYAGSVFNTTSGGVAIRGYDPVAYFTMEKAVKGKEEFTHEWLEATWYFNNAEHRDMFIADPVKYAPQHGGFCSAAVIGGNKWAPIDPRAWRVVDGKLYLFYDSRAKNWWRSKRSSIAETDEEWMNTLIELTQ